MNAGSYYPIRIVFQRNY
ncbi:uncharacterized protein SCDLUD_005335 [Saccharomycodes ludwigii]|nr:hypothetical protein SCDLUD_005335 [Saccharomycodes ludwigii]KAH3898988.1 hypothetical protein SCDLUD_005335 [Saccharomycodes ludwigii]